MGTIAFSKKTEESWVVAGWAFRQILDDIASQCPGDSEIVAGFEKAKAISGLILYELPPDFAAKVTSAIKTVVTGILSGKIRSGLVDQPYGDKPTVQEYRKGLQQLLHAIPPADVSFRVQVYTSLCRTRLLSTDDISFEERSKLIGVRS